MKVDDKRRLAWAAGCAAVAGFVSLSWEIAWFRVYAFTTGGTLPFFGIYLGVYLAGIAVGAVSVRGDCGPRSPERLAKIARTASVLAALAGGVSYLHTPLAAWCAEAGMAPLALVAVGLSAGFYASVLPLVAHLAVEPDERVGRGVACLYLANILGACLGSGLTGFVFLDALGTPGTAVALLVASAVLALAVRHASGERIAARAAFGAAVVAVTGGLLASHAALYDSIFERLLWKTADAREHRFADLIETRAGVVAVTATGTVFGSGVYDGRLNVSLDDDRNGIYRAYALAGLHPRPRRVVMIGLGSGSWAQVIAHHPSVEELIVVEINAGYRELLQRRALVSGLLTNSKVTVVIDDGRRWLSRSDRERYDAIVMNTTFHWRARSSYLLSTEFFALTARRLAPSGLLYFNTTFSDAAMRTACASFASGVRIGSFLAVGNGDVAFDVRAFGKAIADYDIEGRPAASDANAWLAEHLPRLQAPGYMEPCTAILVRTEGSRLITDDNMASETHWPWYLTYHPGPPE